MPGWEWIWPHVQGATPINQGLDSEMFDRSDYPYSETFVREAVQNSLDARLDPKKPVIINFTFHEQLLDGQEEFLASLFAHRKTAGQPPISDWHNKKVRWLVVEDFNSKGLGGDLEDRSSDFCNYWLNFGLSNKDGTGRGGRGIGRVTFLIASKLQAVIGYTRRNADNITAACGMAVLRAQPDGKKFRSTHAYMAAGEQDSVLKLHDGAMHPALVKAFKLTGYAGEYTSGLALVIPYPHDELVGDGILAAVIEHFAPAIMAGTLVVNVDGKRLDKDTIPVVAAKAASKFNSKPIAQDVAGYLGLIHSGLHDEPLRLKASGAKLKLEEQNNGEIAKKLQGKLNQGETVALQIEFPLERNNKQTIVSLKAAIRQTADDLTPIDRFFREGMCLPDVKAKNPAELDLVLLVDDGDLATYLNFCEGKAHLDLLQSKETRAKLEAKGYTGTVMKVRNFVKELPVTLRELMTPDMTEADASVFDAFFAIPSDDPGKKKGHQKGEQPPVPPIPPVPPKPPRIPAFIVEALPTGMRLRANPAYTEWPANVAITMAYANGSKNLEWSEYDFTFDELSIDHEDCSLSWDRNQVKAKNCGAHSHIQITGFDVRRELDTRIRPFKDAQAD